MIRINLLAVREIRVEAEKRQDLIIAVLSLGATLVLLLAVFLFQWYRVSALEREEASLRQEIASLNEKAKEVPQLQVKIAELKEKLKIIDDLAKKKTGPVRVMESLSASTPERLWLTEFKETNGNTSMAGMAVDNQTVADFLRALEKSVYFSDVELIETTQVEQNNVPLKKFSMRSKVSYIPPAPPKPKDGAESKNPPEGPAGAGKKP
jgi:type IV pilus assembly protein PilN